MHIKRCISGREFEADSLSGKNSLSDKGVTGLIDFGIDMVNLTSHCEGKNAMTMHMGSCKNVESLFIRMTLCLMKLQKSRIRYKSKRHRC